MNILVVGVVDRVLSDWLVSLNTERTGIAVLLVSDMNKATQVIDSGFDVHAVLLVRPDINEFSCKDIDYFRLLPCSGDTLQFIVLENELDPECMRVMERHRVTSLINAQDIVAYIDSCRVVGTSRVEDSMKKVTSHHPGYVPASHPGVKRGLTPRQCEVLSLLNQGKSNKQIARELDLTEGTVKVHCKAIFRTLGVVNRTQAAVLLAESSSADSHESSECTLQMSH